MKPWLAAVVGLLLLVAAANIAGVMRWLRAPTEKPAIPAETLLRVATWEDYIAPALLESFYFKHSCRVELTIFKDNNELIELLQQHPDRFDLVIPSSYVVPRLVDAELLAPLDRTKLAQRTRASIDESVDSTAGLNEQARMVGRPYSAFGIPYVMAQTGIAVRVDKTATRPSQMSWSSLGDASLGGRSVHMDMRETFAAALLTNRRGVNETGLSDIDAAASTIKSWRNSGAILDSDTYIQRLLGESHVVAHAYPGDVGRLLNSGSNIDFGIPIEGGSISIEYLCITAAASNPTLAAAFIDHLFYRRDPVGDDRGVDHATLNMKWTCIRYVSPRAYSQLLAELAAERLTNPIPSPLEKLSPQMVLRPLPPAVERWYEESWSSIKAQATGERGHK